MLPSRTLAITIALLACVGCALTEPNESVACLQATSGFGNFGCAVVAGRVLDSTGQPVANVSVGPSQTEDADQFNSPYFRTGLDGRYTIRFTRYLRPTTDSATLWIKAVKIPPPTEAASIRDSVRVRLRVASIGEIPDTSYVDFVLTIP